MSSPGTEWLIRPLESITEIDAQQWNRCANPVDAPYNPFIDHRYLHALEASGSATAETGWQPFHLLLTDPQENVLGAMPLYVKGHSQGEYVFDHAWADALARAGGRYYPKLQSCVPFTPATGRRLLIPSCEDYEQRARALLTGACQVADQIEVSSLHMTFMPEAQWRLADECGLLRRMDQQFHWENQGFTTFDEFLGALNSKKRKNLKRERRDALASGIEIQWLTGSDLREAHWDAFYDFYTDTGNRKWGQPYLTRAFFSQINETFADQTLLIMAQRDGRYIAGALNFIGGDTLFGRHWGCIEDHRFLHFETCYYQAIDFAIARGLNRVEAGAQGSHKVARGYLPTATYSAHWIRDAGFRDAVDRYLREERGYVERDMQHVDEYSPFRKVED